MTATIIVLDDKPIKGSESGSFLDRIDILRALPRKCHDLSWTAFGLWIEFDAEDPHNLAKITTMSESDTGAAMTWDELWSFANLGKQVIEGQFIGYLAGSDPPNLANRNPPEDTLFDENCAAFEIVLEAVDSSLWQICSKDTAMMEELAGKFQHVEGPV